MAEQRERRPRDPMGPAFPAWLQTEADLSRWMKRPGVHCGWDEKAVQPVGSEVCYVDGEGNRVWCLVKVSQRVGNENANCLMTALTPVRYEPAPRREARHG